MIYFFSFLARGLKNWLKAINFCRKDHISMIFISTSRKFIPPYNLIPNNSRKFIPRKTCMILLFVKVYVKILWIFFFSRKFVLGRVSALRVFLIFFINIFTLLSLAWAKMRCNTFISNARLKLTKNQANANPAGIYQLNVNYKNTRRSCEKYSKLTIKAPERRQWPRSNFLTVNFEHISRLVLVFLMLTLNI